MKEIVDLPSAFDPEKEGEKFLVRAKKRASKEFRWTRSSSLEEACRLAYWLHVFGKDDEALQVCDFLAQYEFKGDYNFWTWIEITLALEARLLRELGDLQRAAECVERIRAAGFVEKRLEGALIDGHYGKRSRIEEAIEDGNITQERDWRFGMLVELGFIRELGGSSVYPVERLEREYQENTSRLREIVHAQGR